MSVSEELIHTIKVKVQDLTQRNAEIKSERNKLREEIERLKIDCSKNEVVIAGKESEIASLNRKLQEIKESESNQVDANNIAMKNRISELVQEIDRCIIMLNK